MSYATGMGVPVNGGEPLSLKQWMRASAAVASGATKENEHDL